MSQPVTGYGSGYLDEYTDAHHQHLHYSHHTHHTHTHAPIHPPTHAPIRPHPHAHSHSQSGVPTLSAPYLRIDTPNGASLRLESLAQALRFDTGSANLSSCNDHLTTSAPIHTSPTTTPTPTTETAAGTGRAPGTTEGPAHIMSGHHFGAPAGNMSAILDSICGNPAPLASRVGGGGVDTLSVPVSVFNGLSGGSGGGASSSADSHGRSSSGGDGGGGASRSGAGGSGASGGGAGAVRKPTKSRRSRKRPTGWKPMPRELRVYKKCDYCGEKNHVRQLCCKFCYKSKADMKKIADRNRRAGGSGAGAGAGAGTSNGVGASS